MVGSASPGTLNVSGMTTGASGTAICIRTGKALEGAMWSALAPTRRQLSMVVTWICISNEACREGATRGQHVDLQKYLIWCKIRTESHLIKHSFEDNGNYGTSELTYVLVHVHDKFERQNRRTQSS